MIIFYPRDIERWRNVFTFDIFLTWNPEKPRCKEFYSRQELIDFLKIHGVRLDDPENPLEFLGPYSHHYFGSVYDVKQWTLLGWIKDDLI